MAQAIRSPTIAQKRAGRGIGALTSKLSRTEPTSGMAFSPLRKDCSRRLRLILAFLSWATVIALWVFVTKQELLPPLSFPQPLKVVIAFGLLWTDYDLLGNVIQSWWRIAQAFVLSSLIAIPLG